MRDLPRVGQGRGEVAGVGGSSGAVSGACTLGNQWGLMKMHFLTQAADCPMHLLGVGSGKGEWGAQGQERSLPFHEHKIRKA